MLLFALWLERTLCEVAINNIRHPRPADSLPPGSETNERALGTRGRKHVVSNIFTELRLRSAALRNVVFCLLRRALTVDLSAGCVVRNKCN
jgi:hypothetical protein